MCDALPATLQSTKPHYRQPGRVCKGGTVVAVDVSSEDLPANAIKAEKPGPVRSVDENHSFFRDKTSELAIHNPHYRQQSRVCKGGTDITFYCEVG